ncbi:MAG: phage shock protein operon transcriptional activator [Pseudomonadota bacterium]
MEYSRTPPQVLGEAPAFLDTLAHASDVAALDRPVLVIGERGSGKELIAERIHFLSRRWDGPLVKVNCAALNEELLESELFGHEAGAFTGATKRRLGRFDRAAGGTLFLDEIASTSLRLQEKLLRVIEYGEFERIGGEETRVANTRIVGAANVDLRALAASGKFRADLLDRLAFEVVAVPPLRKRPEDIKLLAAHFSAGIASELGANALGFTVPAMRTLLAHTWPGNIRELKNVVERSTYRWLAAERDDPIDLISIDPFEGALPAQSAFALKPPATETTDGDANKNEIPSKDEANHNRATSEPSAKPAKIDFEQTMHAFERSVVERSLAENEWNQRRTAEALRLTYDQMRGLVRKHKLTKPRN